MCVSMIPVPNYIVWYRYVEEGGGTYSRLEVGAAEATGRGEVSKSDSRGDGAVGR